MQIITLLNEKGGVGKTTLATHIAAGLAIRGKRVLIIDADAQANTTKSFGFRKRPSFHDWVARSADWEKVVFPIPSPRYLPDGDTTPGKLYIMPGDAETRVLPMLLSNPHYIKERLAEAKDVFDVVVFDTSPTPSLLHGAIYMATDSILYPVTPGALELDGLSASMEHRAAAVKFRLEIGMDDIKIGGIVPVMYNMVTNAHDFGLAQLTQRYKNLVWGPVPHRTVWQEAAWNRRLLFAYAPDHEVTKEHLWPLVDRVERQIA